MEITPVQEKEIPKAVDPIIEEMTRAGLHFGRKTSKTHPKMKPYIVGVRSSIHILDLEKTKEKLAQALEAISALVQENKTIVLVGTKIQLRKLVEETGRMCQIPYVSQRWIGGTFTNFDTISKRIAYMIDMKKKREAGELEKYTKKERLGIDKEIEELQKKYGGLETLSKLPSAVFICDLADNQLAFREAKKKGIKIIAICNTDVDPTVISHCIPANDNAISSVKYILSKLQQTILDAQSKIVLVPQS